MATGSEIAAAFALARFPVAWRDQIDKKSRKFKVLERLLVGKVVQLFQNAVATGFPGGRQALYSRIATLSRSTRRTPCWACRIVASVLFGPVASQFFPLAWLSPLPPIVCRACRRRGAGNARPWPRLPRSMAYGSAISPAVASFETPQFACSIGAINIRAFRATEPARLGSGIWCGSTIACRAIGPACRCARAYSAEWEQVRREEYAQEIDFARILIDRTIPSVRKAR